MSDKLEFKIIKENGKDYTINPNTGKKIIVGGQTFKSIFKDFNYLDLESQLYKEKKGKYAKLKPNEFCGPDGGTGVGTFPVNSKKNCSIALTLAKNARNPEGIVKCAIKKSLKKGWKCGNSSKKVKKLLSSKK